MSTSTDSNIEEAVQLQLQQETEGNDQQSLSYEASALKTQLGGVFAWKKEDDERLRSIMAKYQVTNKNIWASVAEEFGDGKT